MCGHQCVKQTPFHSKWESMHAEAQNYEQGCSVITTTNSQRDNSGLSCDESESESFLTMLRYSFWGWFAEDSFCFWGKSIWPGDRGLMLHWLVCQGLLQKAGDAFYEPFMSPVEMMDVTEAFSLWTKSSSFQPDTDHVRKKPQSVIVLIIY